MRRVASPESARERVGAAEQESRRHPPGDVERVRRVEHERSGEVFGAGQFEDVLDGLAQNGEDGHVTVGRGLGERADGDRSVPSLYLAQPVLELLRASRPELHVPPVSGKSLPQRPFHVTPPENSDPFGYHAR